MSISHLLIWLSALRLKADQKTDKRSKASLKGQKSLQIHCIAISSLFDYLSSKSRKSDALLFYELRFRVKRFLIGDDMFETVLTNLDGQIYPPQKLKELYADRQEIETSFSDLKYTLGMLHFHSKKVMCICAGCFIFLRQGNLSVCIAIK